MPLKAGTRIDHYEIAGPLGSGGMGEVYRAKDSKLGRDVAIKVLREEGASDPDRLKRFELEARSASALNHPNLITIYDIGRIGSTPYIAMELVEGQTLREILSSGAIGTRKMLQWAAQVADGLAKAHASGIVHRDLKPENLMISNDGFVKIMDFGLAKLVPHKDAVSDSAPTAELTEPGMVLGTIGYMSPEQAAGRPADHRSDQFSLGSILYEMATGRHAFRKDTAVQTLSAIIEAEPEPLEKSNPDVPFPFRRIVERCLSKAPDGRYDSTRDLAKELQDVRDHHSQISSVPSSLSPSRSRSARPRVVLALVGALAVLLAVMLFRSRAPSARVESLAVLPLENLSGDPEEEYFADGMTEALIADLAKIGALKVISRTSVMQYKGVRKPLPEIAGELSVDAVLEGSVMRSGDRVRITTQLIQAATDRHLWAESYERDLEDVLTLQSELARTIAREIQVKLTPREEARLADSGAVNPQAYEAYLKGLYHWNKLNEEGVRKGFEYFHQALLIDPNYGAAHARLAYTYLLAARAGLAPPKEAYPRAREAALKALELDDGLAEAHAALGRVKFLFDWDWAGAETEFQRALELDPNSATAHQVYALYLSGMGRSEEAMVEIRRAQDLDPLALATSLSVANVFLSDHQYDKAMEGFRNTLEMDSRFALAHLGLGYTDLFLGARDQAVAAFETAGKLAPGDPYFISALATGYAKSGRTAEALERIDELKEMSERRYVPPVHIAVVYVALGDQNEAMAWLEKAYEARDDNLAGAKGGIWFDEIRADPRFQELMRRMGLSS
jgi:serine/threonine-protein kinase